MGRNACVFPVVSYSCIATFIEFGLIYAFITFLWIGSQTSGVAGDLLGKIGIGSKPSSVYKTVS